MPRFKCINENCEMFNKEIFHHSARFYFHINTDSRFDHDKDCDKCKSKLEHIPEETNGEINVYFASFGSQSPERKKEILKKRADEHNRTKMKDRTAEIKKKFINANKLKE